MRPVLVIGNRNYSSWSLRPWIFLRHYGVDFDEIRLPLDTATFGERIAEFSPSRRVPVLIHGERRIWESLAICEYAGDTFPGVRAWPSDPAARAEARSVACEMHAGFGALRREMPMNCRARNRKVTPSDAARLDIRRVIEIWQGARARFGRQGPWLFGEFGIADAMYAPVAVRFLTYGVAPRDRAGEWMHAVIDHPAMAEWAAAAREEPEVIEDEEVG
jgi:glutathione S-transferase